ncbi:MAG: ATP-dependent DNA ligase [Burkholderiales bacterium]|nr:ATP-dependent DNA ligase [Burkholderiales bacterium]
MKRFVDLYLALDATTRTGAKEAALAAYFREAPPHDAAWATFFLTGRRLKRLVRSRDLVEAALTASGVPAWLFEASYAAVGDLAETIALLLPPPASGVRGTLAGWVDAHLAPLAGLPGAEVRARLHEAWSQLDADGRFVYLKLITGAFRVGVARQLVYRALAAATGVPVTAVAQRLAGTWMPSPAFVDVVRGHGAGGAAEHHPYPFFLAHPLESDPATLGPVDDWQAEWKWDGVRAQLVVRGGTARVWSRGDELVSDAFPELCATAGALPDGTVLDGEVLVWPHDASLPAPFAALQRRLNRKAPGPRLQREAPVALCAYDVLELRGDDVRAAPLAQRRAWLEALLPASPVLRLSPVVPARSWDALARARTQSRERHAEGLMLKRLDAAYGVGRVRGPWWKWKVDPYTVDAVLVYAQPGHGRRAGLYTDYTFAVWDGDALVPFAKAYSGLTDQEIRAVDAWIRAHTLERFGPVRRVEPALVFELAFEGLQRSARHRSGIAVRFPRVARWRVDKPAAEADRLESLRTLAEAPTDARAAGARGAPAG